MGPVMSAVSNGLSPGHTAHDNDTITIPKKSFAY